MRLTFAKNGRPCFIMACWLFIFIYCLSYWNNAILHVTSRVLLRLFCNLEIARYPPILGDNFLYSCNSQTTAMRKDEEDPYDSGKQLFLGMRQLFSLIFRSQWRKAVQRWKPKGNHWKALKLFLVIKNGTPGVLDYLSVSGKKLFAGFNQWSDKLYIQHMMQNISKFLGL